MDFTIFQKRLFLLEARSNGNHLSETPMDQEKQSENICHFWHLRFNLEPKEVMG